MPPSISKAAQAALDRARAMRVSSEATPQSTPATAADGPAGVAAPHIITLGPSAFAPKWSKRPTEPVRIGMRLVSEAVCDSARAEATRLADASYMDDSRDARGADEYNDHFNSELMRHVLAHALCQPGNAARGWFEKAPEAEFAAAFPPETVRHLFHEFLELRDRMSPVLPAATADELARFAAALADEDFRASLSEQDRRVLRKMLVRA